MFSILTLTFLKKKTKHTKYISQMILTSFLVSTDYPRDNGGLCFIYLFNYFLLFHGTELVMFVALEILLKNIEIQ